MTDTTISDLELKIVNIDKEIRGLHTHQNIKRNMDTGYEGGTTTRKRLNYLILVNTCNTRKANITRNSISKYRRGAPS